MADFANSNSIPFDNQPACLVWPVPLLDSMKSSQQQTSAQPSNTGFKARLVAAGLLATLGLFAFPADVPVAFWVKSTHPPKELMRYLDLAEVFGHGIGVTMILSLIHI